MKNLVMENRIKPMGNPQVYGQFGLISQRELPHDGTCSYYAAINKK